MMSVSRILEKLKRDGFYVVENVIPEDEVDTVRQAIVAAQAQKHAESEAALAATRAKGHRVGAEGVASLRQVINETQIFAPYLASRKMMDVVDALFGPYARVSCTDCVINYPGNERGYWHADWPYNATNASHVPAPYPDALLHLSSIWMLTAFNEKNGGTFLVPGSHRWLDNPAAGGMDDVDQDAPYPSEMQVKGAAGSVLIYDSRLWHAVASNQSDQPRVALIVRYAPWWLNLNPSHIGKPEHEMMVVETGGKNYESIPLQKEVYDGLPEDVKPLYRHWVEQ
ncbi:MAG: phytanoyl-CoA dioxygenase family protein [Gemmatimonadetes bacterium]|nr:phytanoyl-CoA dioxygenase family protein [Gemmatimonadota bacterium]MYB55922.1 phytanoyl-CoA dioxygenase family protein [Gemmatimonadota bacterium]